MLPEFFNYLICWIYYIKSWFDPPIQKTNGSKLLGKSIWVPRWTGEVSERVHQNRDQYGNIYFSYDGSERIVIIGNYQLATDYCRYFRSTIREYPYLGYVFDELLKKCIGTSSGDRWLALKKPLTKFFTSRSLQNHTAWICEDIQKWSNQTFGNKESIRLQELNLDHLTLRILSKIVYGDLPEDKFQELIQLSSIHNQLMGALSSDFLLRTSSLKSLSNSKKLVDEFLRKWTQFNDLLKSSQQPNTLFETMMNSKIYQEDLECCYSTLYEILLFNLDIMVDTFSSWIWNLATHPDIQEKIYSEVQGIDPEDAIYLPYLTAALNESARLYPGITLTFAETLTEDIVLGDVKLPARTRISLDTQMINRDPNLWEHPDKFSPERFFEQPEERVFQFHHFGLTPRKCLGNVYADRILKILSLTLIQNYQLSSNGNVCQKEARSTLPNLSGVNLVNSIQITKR